ncbi:endonuclease [Actinorhabdospora filicis]|uniref:Endonuclease n=1 Tax=Actinorhabdospora filicis TaxID=1785913 RepID=A0A9W6SP45_9ACTN|nr:endonuclease/exonuclease/phosphatase family protein [Actinorhabdospora filicis]GLZ80425.1 endonuclease [Actinorhabdospora filicis]
MPAPENAAVTPFRHTRDGGAGRPPRAARPSLTALLAVPVALTTLFALVRLTGTEATWPLRMAVAYTPYLAAAALVPPLLALALRRRRLALAGCLAPVVLAALLVPRVLTDGAVVGVPLRVGSANLYYGEADPAAVVAFAREVDVLSVQELTPEAADALDAAGLGEVLPHRVLTPGPGATGTGLYARRPLTPADAPPGRFAMTAAVLDGVEFLAVHTSAPYAPGLVDDWLAELAALPRADGVPRVLAGDFNATLDHAALRALLDSGYTDAAEATGHGLTGTWRPHSGDHGTVLGLTPPPVALDHVLVSGLGVASLRFADLPGGDHRVLAASLALPDWAHD